jgi:alpha-glucoside transport system substrate-binding protein
VAATSRTDFPAGLVELVDLGRPAAVWVTLEVKGLVWYRPSVFADLGLRVPATLDELATLAEQVRSGTNGVAPWCLAAEAGASTGWVGTDWVELYVLRRLGAEAYDRWTTGELRFDDPAIASVFAELDTLLRRPGALAGGNRTTLTTPWARVADPMIANPPRCLMVQQAEFLRDALPAGVRVGPGGDVDVFFLPPARAGEEPPMLVSGLLAAPLDTGPEVEDAMQVLASARLADELNRTGRFVSPNLTASAGLDELSVSLIRRVTGAAVVRFDGSDLMPAAVGTGTFWAGMRAFLAGEQLATVLTTIQAGWDQSPA